MSEQMALDFGDLSIGRAMIDSSWSSRNLYASVDPPRVDPTKQWLHDHAGQSVQILDVRGSTFRIQSTDGSVSLVDEHDLTDIHLDNPT